MRGLVGWMVLVSAALAAATASAQAPAQIPMQGYLTDAGGAALTGEQSVTVALYDADTGGTALYTETQTVMVEEGWFTAYVGDVTALDLATFRDNGVVFAELTVGSETLSPRFQLASVPYAGYAEYAGDAQTVGGMTAAELGAPAWSDITGIPSDLADGDDDTDTTYTAGAGLSLGGTTFSADTSYVQRRVSATCASGSSIRAINGDGTVVCEVDDGVTYGAGTGLSLSGSTFSADTSYLQRRVAGTCPAGQSIRAIASDGSVTCEVDTDTNTTYSAGTGLSLSGTTLSADATYLQRRVTGSCPAGQAIRAITATGSVTCEVDDTSAPSSVDEAALNVQGAGSVSSTADEVVLSRFLGAMGGVSSARVAIVVNGSEGRGAAAGGAGTATVTCGSTTIATIALESGGFRPWTHVTSSFALSCGSTLDVAVRASASASPVVIRDLRVLWGE